MTPEIANQPTHPDSNPEFARQEKEQMSPREQLGTVAVRAVVEPRRTAGGELRARLVRVIPGPLSPAPKDVVRQGSVPDDVEIGDQKSTVS
jgi:hypothetical protein